MTPEELFNSICERVPEALESYKVPGAVLGITCCGQDLVRGFGVTNVNHPLHVDENTLFQFGSITKTFTATAVMRLVEAGRLSLEEPIRRYLPDFSMRDPAVTAELTMRHLLTHTSGFEGDFFPETGNGDDALAKFVALMAQLPQLTPLGTVWSYNNAALALAGRVIEVLTEKTYEAALKELVLLPLGLNQSFLFPTEVMVHRFAVGHASWKDRTMVLHPWQLTRASAAEGGITASVTDLLRYARFHLGDGTNEEHERILSSESMRLMQTPICPATCGFENGLVWRLRELDGVRRVFHGGGTFGQISTLILVPQRRFAFCFATNSLGGRMAVPQVTRQVLPEFFEGDEPELAWSDLDSARVVEYCGRYSAALDDLEISFQDGKLKMRSFPKGGFPTQTTPPGPALSPFQIGLIGPDRIAVVDPPLKETQGEFLRRADGSIEWLRWGFRIHRRI
jgi:CubicO group peptidase (beta-lactamase class C family)